MNMTTFYITTNGCESLRFDIQKVSEDLALRGFLQTNDAEDALITLVFGCTFTHQDEIRFKELVNDLASKRNDGQLIIVTGCYLEEEAREGIVFTRRQSVGVVLDAILKDEVKGLDFSPPRVGKVLPFVAISEGCYGHCAFCSIRFVRGRHRSRPLEVVLMDVQRAFEACGRVKLVGQEIAAYGEDTDSSLPSLVRRIFMEYPGIRIELGSLGPKWMMRFSDADLKVFAGNGFEGNIHLPLQSASDSILKRMVRSYTYAEFIDLLDRLKRQGIERFSTDLMAGFPGETEADHEANIRFLEENPFNFAQIFMFEPRPGTVAAAMDQLPRDLRLRRTLELIATYSAVYESAISKEHWRVQDVLNTNIDINNEEVSSSES